MKRTIIILIAIISFIITIVTIFKENIKNNLYFKIANIKFNGLNIKLCFDIFNDTIFKHLKLKNFELAILNTDYKQLAYITNEKLVLDSGYNQRCFNLQIENILFTKDFFIKIKFYIFGIRFSFLLNKNELI